MLVLFVSLLFLKEGFCQKERVDNDFEGRINVSDSQAEGGLRAFRAPDKESVQNASNLLVLLAVIVFVGLGVGSDL